MDIFKPVIIIWKADVDAVAIDYKDKCVKVSLPNGKTVDILGKVFEQLSDWIQEDVESVESGGFILGYKHKETGNISLEFITTPQPMDERTRLSFLLRDPRHSILLSRAKARKSYYMGVWHTHPQKAPVPSIIDWKDWHSTLQTDKTGCEYIFFLIAGSQEVKIWAGDLETKIIEEVFEVTKEGDLYI